MIDHRNLFIVAIGGESTSLGGLWARYILERTVVVLKNLQGQGWKWNHIYL